MRGFTALLTVTTMAAYLLVSLGATTAATGLWAVLLGHVLAAGPVWLLVFAVALRSWTGGHAFRVRLGATLALVAFPGQALLGATVFRGTALLGARSHLLGGVVVFGLLLLTLVWHLESEVSSRHTGSAEPGGSDATGSGRGSSGDWAVTSSTTGAGLADGGSAPVHPSVGDRLRAYVSLTKPRLMWLLGLLALSGMGLATVTGADLDGVTVVATLGGGLGAVGASGTFNHVYERDRDRRMDRTADRPVATDRVGAWRATAFGLGLFAASMAVLLGLVNPLAAGLTAVAVVYYAVVYTVVLKPATVWNTVIGGGAGALPAVIGWAAVTGSVGLPALLLAAVVFCWTPAHFYNLAIACREEYAAAGYPMLPVERGVGAARRRILYWFGATLLVAGGLGAVAGFGPVYAVTSAVVGLGFAWAVAEQYRQGTDRAAYRSFHASNAYLGAVLVAILVETLVV